MITREFSGTTNKWFGLLFLVLALACLGFAMKLLSTELEFVRTARLTMGEVTGLTQNGTWPTVKFTDSKGAEVTIRTTTQSSLDTFIVGESVEILHSVEKPPVVKLNRWLHLWGDILITILTTLQFGVVAALTLSGKVRWGPLKQTRVFVGEN